MQKFIAALAALALMAGGALADEAKTEEVKGKVKKVDADKSVVVVVVTVDDKEKEVEYAVAKDAKITQTVPGKKKAPATTSELTGGLKSVKDDARVVLTTEKRDGKDVVTALKVETVAKTKKKKAK